VHSLRWPKHIGSLGILFDEQRAALSLPTQYGCLMSLAEATRSKRKPREAPSSREKREARRRSRVRAKRQQIEANGKAVPTVARPVRTRIPFPAQPVPETPADGTPLRLRLDPTSGPDWDNLPESDVPAGASLSRFVTRVVLPYFRFCRACPHCRSEEVYPVTWRGLFIEEGFHRNPLLQRMHCERCLHRFLRPGWALGGIPAPLRPRGLYD